MRKDSFNLEGLHKDRSADFNPIAVKKGFVDSIEMKKWLEWQRMNRKQVGQTIMRGKIQRRENFNPTVKIDVKKQTNKSRISRRFGK